MLWPLAAGLALAATLELAVLRTFTRTAIHIPALEAMAGPYEYVARAGRYAYFVSATLLILLLPVVAFAAWRTGRLPGRAAAVAVATFLVAAALALQDSDGAWPGLLTVGAVSLLAGAVAAAAGPRAALVAFAFALAFGASALYVVAQSPGEGLPAALSDTRLLSVAEWAGVAFALATPLLLSKRPGRRSYAAAAAVAVVVFASLLANGGSTTRILLLWNEGLSGTLPAVAYAAAAGALAVTVFGLARERQWRMAAGLCFILCGGIGLHSTYQGGLVVAGMALWSLGPAAFAGVAARAAERGAPTQPEAA
jgi:hypothetical protein